MTDFCTFARWHVLSGDVDPVYPVLGHLLDQMCDDDEEQLQLVLLYVAYYDLGSAITTWLDGFRFDRDLNTEELKRSTGTERRAHRDTRQFARHITSLRSTAKRYGSFGAWLQPQVQEALARWQIVQDRLIDVHGNGRWAAYKTGEILDSVLDWSCPPPDAGHANSSGPRHGLAILHPETAQMTGNSVEVIARLDELTHNLCDATELPVAQVETVLCDFHSLVKGNYYVGHDIDLMLQQTRRLTRRDARLRIMEAREVAFDHVWLGERQDWTGVRKELKKKYMEDRTIEWWD